MEETMEMQEA